MHARCKGFTCRCAGNKCPQSRAEGCCSPTATAATASKSAMLVRCDTGGCAASGLSSAASLSAWLLGGKASILAVLARVLSSRVLVRYTSSDPRGEAAAPSIARINRHCVSTVMLPQLQTYCLYHFRCTPSLACNHFPVLTCCRSHAERPMRTAPLQLHRGSCQPSAPVAQQHHLDALPQIGTNASHLAVAAKMVTHAWRVQAQTGAPAAVPPQQQCGQTRSPSRPIACQGPQGRSAPVPPATGDLTGAAGSEGQQRPAHSTTGSHSVSLEA
jgi:hypothetical protein